MRLVCRNTSLVFQKWQVPDAFSFYLNGTKSYTNIFFEINTLLPLTGGIEIKSVGDDALFSKQGNGNTTKIITSVNKWDTALTLDNAENVEVEIQKTSAVVIGTTDNLSVLKYFSNLKMFAPAFGGDTDVKQTGSLTALADCLSLVYINAAGTSITGEVNDFAAAQVAKGRTSGTCKIASAYNGITKDGNSFSSCIITFDSQQQNGYTIA